MLTFNGPSALLYLPDEAIESTFEVLMPSLDLSTINGVQEQDDMSWDGNTSTWNNLKKIGKSFGTKLLTSRYYTPIVEAINFAPLQKFKNESSRIRDMYVSAPVDQEKPDDAKITLFCSSAMTAYYYLSCWHNLIYDRKNECYNAASDYKRNIIVYYYGHDDLVTAEFTLEGCFPVDFPKLDLNYDKTQRITLQATFNVDRVVQNDNVKVVATTKEYAAHIAPNLMNNIIPGAAGAAGAIAGAAREIFN